MENRKGDWFQTYTGIKFYPYDPRPEEVFIEDIAHHLSLQCRFYGACREFYSVGQHSILVSSIVSRENALWGLLHDATEAYLGDMIRPVKLGMPQYREVEQLVMKAIADRYELEMPEPDEVKGADRILLYTERRDLLKIQRVWSENIVLLKEVIIPWQPKLAKASFLYAFSELRQLHF